MGEGCGGLHPVKPNGRHLFSVDDHRLRSRPRCRGLLTLHKYPPRTGDRLELRELKIAPRERGAGLRAPRPRRGID